MPDGIEWDEAATQPVAKMGPATEPHGGIEWDEDATQHAAQPEEAPGPLSTFIRTAGHVPGVDQLAGLVGAGVNAASAGSLSGFGHDYSFIRDASRRDREAGSEANPWASRAGNATNFALTVAAPVGAVFKAGQGAGVGARIAAAAGNGAVMGGVSGLLDGGADLAGGDVAGALKDTAIGAGIGGALGGIVHGGIEAAPVIADKLRRFAGNRAFDAAGGMLKDYRLLGPEKVAEVGGNLLDTGGVRALDSTKNVADRLGDMRDAAGARVGNAISALDQAATNGSGVSGAQLAREMEQKILAPLSRFPAQRDVAQRVASEIEAVRALGNKPVSFEYLEGLKRSFDPAARFGSVPNVGNEMVGAFRDMRGVAMGASERAAQGAGLPQAAEFIDAKKAYGLLAPAEHAASDKALRLAANRQISPSSYLAAAAGATGPEGSTAKGLLFGLANKVLLDRGSSTAAVGANMASKVMRAAARVGGKYAQTFAQAAARGPQAVGAWDFVLSQRDPEWRKHKAEADAAEKEQEP